MQPKVQRQPMQTVFDVHQHDLSSVDRARMEEDLDGLARQVEKFPIADLHILIEGNARSNDVSIKLTLILSGSTLVANDHDVVLSTAFQRCLNSLLHEVEAYEARLDDEDDRQKINKGTLHPALPTRDIDLTAVDRAVAAGDYSAFRLAMLPFEDPVQARAGRWIQRYPKYESRIGKDVKLSDVTEDVFLTAFDRYGNRPDEVPLGDWLTSLIDPAIKAIMTRTAEEMENINHMRNALNATQPIV